MRDEIISATSSLLPPKPDTRNPKPFPPMTPIEEIKNRLDILDIVGETVQLRRSGNSYTGFCPFHSNTRTPSFVVFPDSQTWRCFGACAEGGDIFGFVMKRNGWEFRETLEYLANRAGVQLEAPTPQKQAAQETEAQLADLLEAAADYFHQLLLHAPQAEQARHYVRSRALTVGTVKTFKLGYALESWQACAEHFMAQGYSQTELLAAGLLTENVDKGTLYDRFRDRLMFPIRNAHGRVVGFGARTLAPDGLPKYLNSPQTDLFDKSHLLYGLDQSKRYIREARQAVIVEGYMDVIRAWQAGYRNVIAQMGTALTEPQLLLLKRYTKRFIIALDADAAGIKATMRSLTVARQTLDRETEISFDAPGLVQSEGRLQADIRIVTLPAGEDPDSLIRHDKEAWPKLVSAAKPVVEYVIQTLISQIDFNDPKAKTDLANQVIPLINDVPNPIEREHYWQYLGRALRMDDRILRQLNVPDKATHAQRQPHTDGVPQNQTRPTIAPAPTRPHTDPNLQRQANFLRHCLQDPGHILPASTNGLCLAANHG
jgi:DNA primase